MVSILDKEKRKKKLRAESQEAWRDKLDFNATLKSIVKLEDDLVLAGMNKKDYNSSALNMALQSKWKRLDKLLPSLKHTEGHETGTMEITIIEGYSDNRS